MSVAVAQPRSHLLGVEKALLNNKEDLTPSDTKIEAKFSLEKYLLREAKLKSEGSRPCSLPLGYPSEIYGDVAWSGQEFDLAEITHTFSSDDISRIEGALEHFNGKQVAAQPHVASQPVRRLQLTAPASGLGLNKISPQTFQLQSLGTQLRHISLRIHEGVGAVIFKGLQPDKYSSRDNAIIFAGIASYIGDQRGAQSSQNDVLSMKPRAYSSNDPILMTAQLICFPEMRKA